MQPPKDPRMLVTTIHKTVNPQSQVYLALHSCYSVEPAIACNLSESIAGEIAVKRLLSGNRGHLSPFEQIQIAFNCAYIPHSVIAQITRHRHVSFSVQSFRYTSPPETDSDDNDIENIFYLRQPGQYPSRSGIITYTEEMREEDLHLMKSTLLQYHTRVRQGIPPEQARGLLSYDYRQHFMCSFNARALMDVLDLRAKADAQWEIQQLADMFFREFKIWVPEIATWYEKHRLTKARN